MTVHIAVASGRQAVLFSDSQGSTPQAESHGWHKQFLGKNFVVGMAGATDIIDRLFTHLKAKHGVDHETTVTDLMKTIETFYRDQVRPGYWASSDVIVLGYDSDGNAVVHQYNPARFVGFGPAKRFGSIGSGSEFVDRAKSRDEELGISLYTDTLEEMLVTASHYAEAANESLTVDDSLAVAILDSGESYLMGDFSLSVRYAPEAICQFWNRVAASWNQLQTTIQAINREVVSAQREFSNVRRGELNAANLQAIEQTNDAVRSTTNRLTQQLEAFKQTYNDLKSGDDPASMP